MTALASRVRWLALLAMLIAAAVMLGGCRAQDRDEGERRTGATAMAAALPVPEAARGGVTGMPALPGPGAIGAPDPEPDLQLESGLEPMLDNVTFVTAPDEPHAAADDGSSSTADSAPAAGPRVLPGEPGAHEAVAVLRAYYVAIDSGSFARAYRLWSGDGAATGQSLQQFADSFAGTARHSMEFRTPGRIDASADARYIELPVAIEETRSDGSMLLLAGAYTLRRAAADGASIEQSAWRIVSADLREVVR